MKRLRVCKRFYLKVKFFIFFKRADLYFPYALLFPRSADNGADKIHIQDCIQQFPDLIHILFAKILSLLCHFSTI